VTHAATVPSIDGARVTLSPLMRPALVVVLCCGCQWAQVADGEDVTPLPDWTLEVPGEPPLQVTLPAHLEVPRDQRYVLSQRRELDRSVDLVIPRLPAEVVVRADGIPLTSNVDDPIGGYRRRGPHVFPIPSPAFQDGEVRLEIEVAHRWTQSAWIEPVPRLVPSGRRDAASLGVLLVDLVAAICGFVALTQIGLTCLVIFGFDRRRKPYLFFGVQAVTAAVYPLFVLGPTQLLFGRYDVGVMAACLVVAPVASIYFTHTFFGLRPVPRWVAVVTAGAVLWCLATNQPYLATRYATGVTVVTVVLACVYQLVTCARLVLTHPDRASAVLQLCSWLGLAGTAWVDLAAWFGLGEGFGGARPACVGLGLFGFFLTLLLSLSHTRSLSGAAERDEAVAAKREIERLNDELRRQIHERSGQLSAALALIGGAREMPRLEEGTLVEGRYRVHEAIGEGGMGVVYRVTRESDGAPFALKVTRETHGTALARLAREAQVATTVSHPNLVRVVDVDIASEGFLFVVMELVDGAPLDVSAARPWEWASVVLRQIAAGLEALHAADLVHRDLKPANVLVRETEAGPVAKITDFGISRALQAPGATRTRSLRKRPEDATETDGVRKQPTPSPELTGTGLIPGTPAYIAPELVDGPSSLSPAADVFGVGVIAYELLTGARPFARPLALALLDGTGAREPARIVLPEVPEEVATTLSRCLARDPAARPSATELVEAFAPVRSSADV